MAGPTSSAARVLTNAGLQRALRLRAYRGCHVARYDVQHIDLRIEVTAQRIGKAHRKLGMRSAAHGRQDALDARHAALLDDRDVAGRLAHHLVDRRAEHRGRAASTSGPSAPAKENEVGLLFGGGLDDPFGCPTPDSNLGAQLDAFRRELQHLLEQPPRVARLRRPFRERDAFRHFHDSQCRERAAGLHQGSADPHQVARRTRIRNRQQDSRG
jgi:hypothetical protein